MSSATIERRFGTVFHYKLTRDEKGKVVLDIPVQSEDFTAWLRKHDGMGRGTAKIIVRTVTRPDLHVQRGHDTLRTIFVRGNSEGEFSSYPRPVSAQDMNSADDALTKCVEAYLAFAAEVEEKKKKKEEVVMKKEIEDDDDLNKTVKELQAKVEKQDAILRRLQAVLLQEDE